MKICPTCRHTGDDTLNFCPVCGVAMQAVIEEPVQPVQAPVEPTAPAYAEPAQPVYAEPVQPAYVAPPQYTYAQPPYVQPTYVQPPYVQPQAPVSKGRLIPGMALGIAGMATAILGMLYTTIYFFIGMAMPEMAIAAAVMGFIFMAISLPLSIVGFKMSSSNRAMGDQSKLSSMGVTFGRVGLILSIVMGVISFLALIVGASTL